MDRSARLHAGGARCHKKPASPPLFRPAIVVRAHASQNPLRAPNHQAEAKTRRCVRLMTGPDVAWLKSTMYSLVQPPARDSPAHETTHQLQQRSAPSVVSALPSKSDL